MREHVPVPSPSPRLIRPSSCLDRACEILTHGHASGHCLQQLPSQRVEVIADLLDVGIGRDALLFALVGFECEEVDESRLGPLDL